MSADPTTAPLRRRRPWHRYRWLLLRRLSQSAILGLFLLGPWFDIWWVKGNLASSLWLDTIPLSDPYIALQSLAASGFITQTALLGAAIVFAGYWLLGGRVYCSWVCPVNVITDVAHWCRERLHLPPGWRPARSLRLWLLGMTVIASALTGSIVWELVNPVTMVQRALVFGLGMAWAIMLAVFLFDLIVSRRGWCGHICPVGAFYGLVGASSPVRVAASAREACTDCGDCFEVCPEPQVITPALRGSGRDTRLILSGDCTNCGRCIDVCDDRVFTIEWKPKAEKREREAELN
jgi:ferredoxin-type protein NapH